MSFSGKNAVVTGGNSGIGRALAIAFARAGANVLVAGLRPETKAGDFGEQPDRPVVDLLRSEGLVAEFIRADVCVAADMQSVARRAIEVFGGLDIWVNNAGVVAPPRPFWEYDEADFDRCLEINCRGVWNGMRAAARSMLESRTSGSIINILSTAAIRPHAGQAVYNISKAAAAQATRCAALELGPSGIRVNGICPTVVRTAISRDFVETEGFQQWFRSVAPLGSPVDAQDVVAAALFLAGVAAGKVTGILMPVDSGEVLGPPGAELHENA